jgi:hypothetical protein
MSREEYSGVGSLEAAYGQSYWDSTWGSLAGAAGGAGVAAIAVNAAEKDTMKVVNKLPFGDMMKSKTGVIVGGALAGAVILGTITSITGFFSGMKKADGAKSQFYEMKAQRDSALAQLRAVESVAGARFSDRVSPRGQAGGYADAVQADRAHGSEAAR